MTIPTPFLSIVTPLYNRAWCIADCIASTGLAGLAPDSAVEMIVVDDGSRDGSPQEVAGVAEKLGLHDRLRLIAQENAGPGAARNTGVRAARGEWVVFLDSDDLWFPWTLPTLLEALRAAPPEADLAFLRGLNFADEAELSGILPGKAEVQTCPTFLETVQKNPALRYGTCNAAVRRSAFEALGCFAPELRCSEDTDLFLRVTGKVVLLRAPDLVALRRAGHDTLTGNAPEVARGFDWMLQADRSGRYPGPAAARRDFLAGSCAYAVRMAFAAGHVGLAYGLYLRHLPLLLTRRTRKHLLRLPLTPLLHLVRPGAYPFRRRPG